MDLEKLMKDREMLVHIKKTHSECAFCPIGDADPISADEEGHDTCDRLCIAHFGYHIEGMPTERKNGKRHADEMCRYAVSEKIKEIDAEIARELEKALEEV